MKGITFPAWYGEHYVTLAELLVRLGSFGLDLKWRVEFDEIVDPRCAEMERRSADGGVDTLTLLSLTTPFLQLIDAEALGFAGDGVMIALTEVDSSLWDVRAVDERVLGELRRHYPGARESSAAPLAGRDHKSERATPTLPSKVNLAGETASRAP
ncbi:MULTISPECIES: hypothetical protein [unclassified Kitasatospora]|uniref:hypothetical protein n=1 Tax=unclassified Kitasatospora TaxID=2633591 RepID=UPI00382032A8